MKGRQRGRNGGKPRMHNQSSGGGGGRNQNFDHNAGRMRGNAQQLLDKYLTLGRDASLQGDRVLAENYLQHADHYYRVVNARFEGQQNQNQNNNQNQQHRRFNGSSQGDFDGQDGQDGQGNYNDYNRSDIAPGPSQNLIPSAQQVTDQSHVQQQHQPQQHQPQAQPQQHQPQQNFDNSYQPQHQQPEPREPDGDIGLPPTLFGEQPQRAPVPQAGGDQPGNAPSTGDGRGFRPRHSGRRRSGPARGVQQPAEPTGESS
jgi:hypothetical protein